MSAAPSASPKPGVRELAVRDVDADDQAGTRGRAPPGREPGGRLPQHPAAERDDQAGLLGDRQELGRLDEAVALRPAAERLEAGDPAGGGLHDRLVGDLEPALLDRLPQLGLHVQPAHHLLVHAGVEDGLAPAAVGLGAVHGDVGVAQDRLGRRVGAGERDPDAGVDVQLAVADHERRFERRADALGHERRLVGVGRRRREGR